jgi:translin
VHRLDPVDADRLLAAADAALRAAQDALAPFPGLVHGGFLHDAEKEFVEARLTAQLVTGAPLSGPAELGVSPTAWMRGLAEAASELRRHLLDRLRDGDLARGEALLGVMDDVYDALVVVDYPDALTSGLRRTLDALRAVLERTRGDVTTTVLQTRLRDALERRGGS